MIKETYFIIASKIDEDLGIVSGSIKYSQEYDQYPSTKEIENVIKTLDCQEARVEKIYKLQNEE